MRSTVSALGDKMGASIAGMKDDHKETVACQETTEVRLGCKKPTSEDKESEVKSRKVLKEHAVVRSSGIRKKRQKGRDLAAGRSRKPEELTQGDCGSRGKLAAACRKVSRRAAVAWRKRYLSRNIWTRGNCGSLRRLTIAGRKMIHRARVAWRKRGVVRKNWIRAKVTRGTRRAQTRQEGKMGIKDPGGTWPRYLTKARTSTTNGIGAWNSGRQLLLGSR
jgi:hypothetical protein